MKNTTLVILAAGMGSRFGGLKQIEPLGPHGESIIEYSVYDAIKAGFNKVVIIIKKAIEEDFKAHVGKRLEKAVHVEYAFQELDMLPEGYTIPEGREKPWGTAHAVLCAKQYLTEPFATINADDYYGPEAFQLIHDQLISSNDICMVGYQLGNTLSEKGTVSRGICETENGYLTKITENTALDKNSGFPMETTVSMNMWGYQPEILPLTEKYFLEFLDNVPNTPNPLKAEFFLPLVSDKLINDGYKCKVLKTTGKWYGVTYKDDADQVRAALKEITESGVYPKETRVNG
ncbi:MAG: NTP transferase domain-containing protein [Clostridia bacterium]|nr:NTP transferase domain-containing protein [Clostridia bacterium]